jgi:hypothetical protein
VLNVSNGSVNKTFIAAAVVATIKLIPIDIFWFGFLSSTFRFNPLKAKKYTNEEVNAW